MRTISPQLEAHFGSGLQTLATCWKLTREDAVVRHLTDYFQKQSVIPKFYFIVDRIDLLVQAHREFTSRGLIVHSINSRVEFARDIKSTEVIHNLSGKPEIKLNQDAHDEETYIEEQTAIDLESETNALEQAFYHQERICDFLSPLESSPTSIREDIVQKMIRDLFQLIKPLQYLCIKNTRRGLYQLYLPALSTVAMLLLLWGTQQPIEDIFTKAISQVTATLQIMIPFTITALAAIATFPSKILDSTLAGEPTPYLQRRKRGQIIEDKLSRRRYLCLLFGYMAFVGLFVVLLAGLSSVGTSYFNEFKYIYHWVILAIITFMSANLFVNTLLGIFYLSDRIHRDK